MPVVMLVQTSLQLANLHQLPLPSLTTLNLPINSLNRNVKRKRRTAVIKFSGLEKLQKLAMELSPQLGDVMEGEAATFVYGL